MIDLIYNFSLFNVLACKSFRVLRGNLRLNRYEHFLFFSQTFMVIKSVHKLNYPQAFTIVIIVTKAKSSWNWNRCPLHQHEKLINISTWSPPQISQDRFLIDFLFHFPSYFFANWKSNKKTEKKFNELFL